MCARCEELEHEVAWLRSELGIVHDTEVIDRGRKVLGLSPGETRVLVALYAAKGRPLSNAQILERLPTRGAFDERDNKQVTVYICRIRQAIGSGAIENVWGQGYRITSAGAAAVSQVLAPQAEARAA